MANLNKTQETGRSMVEMLGVLAVIGVLSIAGVAGYTTAMNKHRANEILNGASVRAVVVSTQLQKNKDATPTLAEFGEEAVQGVTFGTPSKVGDNQFQISLTGDGLTTDVCSQMKNIVGEDGIVNISDDCATLTYNNDLSAGVTIAPTGWTATCDPECTGTDVCINGNCVAKADADNFSCTSNSGCTGADKDQFCLIGGGLVKSCSKVERGTCTEPTTTPDDNSLKITIGSGTNAKTFYKSYTGMSWWSAQNYCNKYHHGLASLSELGISIPSGQSKCGQTNYGMTPCTLTGGITWDALKASTALGRRNDYWVSDYPSGNSCKAYSVAANVEYVNANDRSTFTIYALCK